MTTAPAPLPPVVAAFDTAAMEAKMMELKAKVEEFAKGFAEIRPQVYAAATALVTASLGAALPYVTQCLALFEASLVLVPKVIQWFNDLSQWVWAPMNIVDIATALNAAYDHATDCSQALLRQAMPADAEWEGESVDAYYGHIEAHNAAALAAESALNDLKTGIQGLGDSAVVATYVALGALIVALIDAIVGLIALIPPATPGGAAILAVGVGLMGATVAGLVTFAQTRVSAVDTFTNTVSGKLRGNAFPGGEWPKPTSKAVKDSFEEIEGWNWE